MFLECYYIPKKDSSIRVLWKDRLGGEKGNKFVALFPITLADVADRVSRKVFYC